MFSPTPGERAPRARVHESPREERRCGRLRMVTKLTHAPLHRLLSKLGLASRTQAIELVGAGRVRVNGLVVHDPQQWSPWDGLVEIDRGVVQASRARLLCLHKRRGVVTARVDAREKVVCDHPMLRDTGVCHPGLEPWTSRP